MLTLGSKKINIFWTGRTASAAPREQERPWSFYFARRPLVSALLLGGVVVSMVSSLCDFQMAIRKIWKIRDSKLMFQRVDPESQDFLIGILGYGGLSNLIPSLKSQCRCILDSELLA